MSIPTVPNFNTTKIPVEGQPTFRANATYVFNTLINIINSFNSAISSINSTSSTISTQSNNVAIDTATTQQNRDEAVSAKDEAVLAKNEIQGYVIPLKATYSPTTIEAKLAMASTLNLTGTM